VRTNGHLYEPEWTVQQISLEEIVLAAGISMVAFLGIRLFIENSWRPSSMNPIQMTWDALDADQEAIITQFGSGNWFLSQGMVDAAGRTLSFDDPIMRTCGVGMRNRGENWSRLAALMPSTPACTTMGFCAP